MTIKILICGDSYCITDSDYPNLHWSEKLLGFSSEIEIINLAFGGCSNALIALQLAQGLKLNPDFVVLSFTSDRRYELDKNVNAIPKKIDGDSIAQYIKERYTTNNYNVDDLSDKAIKQYILDGSSDNFETLKNYFYISFCLTTLAYKNIPFCFTLGGFEFKKDYVNFLNSNYIENSIINFSNNQLNTNLWYFGNKQRPYFHVDRDDVHELFAQEILSKILSIKSYTQ
jgi:hypothetical protein